MTFRCPYENPETLRTIIMRDCIALGSTVSGYHIPWFFLAIERLYNYKSSPFIFTFENMDPTEIEILENHAVPFTKKMYIDYSQFRRWVFEMFDRQVRQERDHFILKGMRIYRLELYPIIMKVLSEPKQKRFARTIRMHVMTERGLEREVRQKWNADDQIMRFFRNEPTYGWEYKKNKDKYLETFRDEYTLVD